MLQESILFEDSDRYMIDRSIIDDIATPVGDWYGDDVFTEYFSFYAGMSRRHKPKRIFEIGVRYGYNAIAMLVAQHKLPGAPKPEFVGVDDESYHFGSCDRANQNFAKVVPWAKAQCLKACSWYGLPNGIGTFDFISVDAHHDRAAILNDASRAWPILNDGGIMYFDDATPGNSVYEGIMEFLIQFENRTEVIQFQSIPNLRDHFAIRKNAG